MCQQVRKDNEKKTLGPWKILRQPVIGRAGSKKFNIKTLASA